MKIILDDDVRSNLAIFMGNHGTTETTDPGQADIIEACRSIATKAKTNDLELNDREVFAIEFVLGGIKKIYDMGVHILTEDGLKMVEEVLRQVSAAQTRQ